MATLNIPVTKAGTTLSVDTDSLPEEAFRSVVEAGLKALLNLGMSKILTKGLEGDQLSAAQAAALRTTGSYITFKNATLKVDGQPVPNNTADVRVLAALSERAWYDGPFDPDNAQVPVCYALDSEEPHPESKDPQSETCKECPKNKWGSAPPRPGSTVAGKGKACREGARLIMVPAGIPLTQRTCARNRPGAT